MNICSIITARGGSKGLPKKNIKPLNGKPVIAYSIETSISNSFIEDTYVTTEDNEIMEISKKFGAKIIERPLNLATDESSSVDVVLHSLNYLKNEGKQYDFFILLQPTSPLRTNEDLNKSINLFIENECDALISVSQLNHSSMMSFKLKNKFLTPNCDEEFLNKRRQELPNYYCPNGAIYITTEKSLQKTKSFIPKKTIPYIMPRERSVDLDTEFDLKLIEFLLNHQNMH